MASESSRQGNAAASSSSSAPAQHEDAAQEELPRLCLFPPLTSLQWIQGDPTTTMTDLTQNLQLCVLMQVNCPGCHTHAIPVLHELAQCSSSSNNNNNNDLNVWCLFTAFEDFDYNTVENTAKLLQQRERVGVPRQQLGAMASAEPTCIPPVDMPVAFDVIVPKDTASSELIAMAMAATKQNARQQALAINPNIPSHVLEQALQQLSPHDVLPAQIAWTFYAAAAQGTPTWILYHGPTRQIWDQRLGPQSVEEIMEWVQACRCAHYAHSD